MFDIFDFGGLDIFDPTIRWAGAINIFPSGDPDDYIQFSVTSNVPLIKGVGSYLALGKTGSAGSATTADDIFMGGKLEVDGVLYADGGMTIGGAVAGGDQSFTNVGDMTFAAGSILASGSTNGNTLLLRSNDTTFITFTTGATDVCTIANATMSGTWLASGTVTLPAVTLGGAVTLNGQVFGAGAGELQINTTGGQKGVLVQSTNDGTTAAQFTGYAVSASPAIDDFTVLLWGKGKTSTGALMDYGYYGIQIESPTNTNEKGKHIWYTVNGGAWNVAMTLSAAGALWIDSGLTTGAASSYINDTANANMTVGLTINQGTADNQIFALKSSDVAHGCTTQAETDTYSCMSKVSADGGGLLLKVFTDAEHTATYPVISYQALSGIALDTTKSTAGRAAIEYEAYLISGTGVANLGADANIFAVRGWIGGAHNTVAIVDEDGDLWLNGGITAGGSSVSGYSHYLFGGDKTSDGSSNWAFKFGIAGTLTAATGDTGAIIGFNCDPVITTQSQSETIAYVAGAAFHEPAITKGTDTVTVAATAYIEDAPTEGATNAALYIASGDASLDTLTHRGSALGFYAATPVVKQAGFAALKTDYATPDLDTEAEIIAALNTTNAALNAIRTAMNNYGLMTVV